MAASRVCVLAMGHDEIWDGPEGGSEDSEGTDGLDIEGSDLDIAIEGEEADAPAACARQRQR